MSFSYAFKFNEPDQTLAKVCKSLAHPARIKIVRILLNAGSQPVPFKTFKQELPLHKSSISQHLRQLRKEKLIYCYQDGANTSYELNSENLSTFQHVFFLATAANDLEKRMQPRATNA